MSKESCNCIPGHYLRLNDQSQSSYAPPPANFSLPPIQLDGDSNCVSFYYAKADPNTYYRYDTPELRVMVEKENDTVSIDQILPEPAQYQADGWLNFHLPISDAGNLGDLVTVNFIATKLGPNFYGYVTVALDDFEILPACICKFSLL